MAAMVLTAFDRSIGHDALRACRLFADIDERSLERCVEAMRQRRSRRGEVIFHAGDPGDALFVVVSGAVKILLPASDGSEAAILTTIGPGGFFGELALLDDSPRSATAEALEPSLTLILRRDAFDRLLEILSGLDTPVLGTVVNSDASAKSYGYSSYESQVPSVPTPPLVLNASLTSATLPVTVESAIRNVPP